MIGFRHKGDFKSTEKLLQKSIGRDYRKILDSYAQEGVILLANATPVDSGKTANSWSYEIIQKDSYISIVWKNANVYTGVNIAILIQYGHGTRNGGYVQGFDYINPALRPIFQRLADACWKEVTGK